MFDRQSPVRPNLSQSNAISDSIIPAIRHTFQFKGLRKRSTNCGYSAEFIAYQRAERPASDMITIRHRTDFQDGRRQSRVLLSVNVSKSVAIQHTGLQNAQASSAAQIRATSSGLRHQFNSLTTEKIVASIRLFSTVLDTNPSKSQGIHWHITIQAGNCTVYDLIDQTTVFFSFANLHTGCSLLTQHAQSELFLITGLRVSNNRLSTTADVSRY